MAEPTNRVCPRDWFWIRHWAKVMWNRKFSYDIGFADTGSHTTDTPLNMRKFQNVMGHCLSFVTSGPHCLDITAEYTPLTISANLILVKVSLATLFFVGYHKVERYR